jgi:hypothetical protein
MHPVAYVSNKYAQPSLATELAETRRDIRV